MKSITIKQFGEKELEMVSALRSLGMDRKVASVLVYLGSVPNASAREIEQGANLRQPEVSLGLKYLRIGGAIGTQIAPERGEVHNLTLSMDDIIRGLAENAMHKNRENVKFIEQARQIAKDWMREAKA